MSQWPQVKLEDVVIARPGNGKIIKGTLPTENSGKLFPAYSATGQDVFSEEYDHEGEGIVVSAVGARCGKCFLATGRWRAIANTHVLLPHKDKINSRFLWYLINNENFWIKGGTAQPFVKMIDSLRNFIPLPPLPEQERIVRILGEAEALRRLRTRANSRTDELISALFYELFGDSSQWPGKALHKLLAAIDSGWSPVCRDEPAKPDEWGILKLSSVTYGEYREGENKALPQEFDPRPSIEVQRGDVLFTRKNTYELVAATAYVWNTRPKLMLSDLIFRLRPRPDVGLDSFYLCYSLANPVKRREIQRLAGGSAGSMPNISKERLMSVSIPLPPLDLQHVFAMHANTVRSLQIEQTAGRQRLDDLFQSLLHRAFQGEL